MSGILLPSACCCHWSHCDWLKTFNPDFPDAMRITLSGTGITSDSTVNGSPSVFTVLRGELFPNGCGDNSWPGRVVLNFGNCELYDQCPPRLLAATYRQDKFLYLPNGRSVCWDSNPYGPYPKACPFVRCSNPGEFPIIYQSARVRVHLASIWINGNGMGGVGVYVDFLSFTTIWDGAKDVRFDLDWTWEGEGVGGDGAVSPMNLAVYSAPGAGLGAKTPATGSASKQLMYGGCPPLPQTWFYEQVVITMGWEPA